MTDPIADMLTRIRNANQNRAKTVTMPSSIMKETIAKILKDEGYITDYTVNKNEVQNILKQIDSNKETTLFNKNKDDYLILRYNNENYYMNKKLLQQILQEYEIILEIK